MNFEETMQLIAKWGGTLKFFPADKYARLGIAEEIGEMASNADQVRWLVQRLPKLYAEWPAMREVRAVFCSKFKPADGIECYSAVYLEGVPSEKADSLALAAPPQQRRIAGGTTEPASAAQSIVATLSDLVRAKDMNRTLRGITPPKVRDIPVRQITDENRITPEQIAEAERKLHTAQAKAQVAK